MPTADAIQAALATVEDPEIRRPITELNMVKDVQIEAEVLVTWCHTQKFGRHANLSFPALSRRLLFLVELNEDHKWYDFDRDDKQCLCDRDGWMIFHFSLSYLGGA